MRSAAKLASPGATASNNVGSESAARLNRIPVAAGAVVCCYSLRILSAHSTNATKSGGVTNRAFLASRSASRTARAREHAVQILSGIL